MTQLRAMLALRLASALATGPSALFVPPGIHCVIRMTLRAMCNGLMASAHDFWAYAPCKIHLLGHRFKVRWVHAVSYPTEMVDLQARRYGADEQAVSVAVGKPSSRGMQQPIAVLVRACRPEPARLCLIDVLPEALNGIGAWVYSGWHRIFLSVSMRTAVTAARPLSILPEYAAGAAA